MIKVISVRFRTAGKVYFFDPVNFDIKKGQHVIVETARGVEYGLVVGGIREVEDDKVIQPLKPVIRIANEEDDRQEEENLKKKEEAYNICLEKIRKHGLEMKLVDAEYTFDNNKVLFYFTADGRIDFRELVKDLAAVFKTRIELRQIGVRDEIKIMGGIGVCGRVLCCHSYLSEFIPVSIKMAKEQNLSLNPTKISGVCGRLMCCLKNEEEIYGELNKKLPNVGDYVTADDGLRGEVHSVNVLRQLVKVIVDVGDEKEIKEYHTDQLHFKRKFRKEKAELTDEELIELENLERQESEDKIEKAERMLEKQSRERQNKEDRANRNNGSERPNNRRENKYERKIREDRKNAQNLENEGKPSMHNEGRMEGKTENRSEGRNEGRSNRFDKRMGGRNNNRNDNTGARNADAQGENPAENHGEGRSENKGGRSNNKFRRNKHNRYERREGKPKTDDNTTAGE